MGLTIGLDVGGTKVLGVAVDERGVIQAEHRVPTPEGADQLTVALVGLTTVLRGQVVGPVIAVGLGLAGLVDADGMLHSGPNLPGIEAWPAREVLGERLGLPVRVDNDANVAAWGELVLGAGRGAANLVVVTLGTGIGGGVVIDGRLLRGAHGYAGEVGHLPVVVGGRACPCGALGCWERYASGTALGIAARERVAAGQAPALLARAGGVPTAVSGEHVTAAAADGDPDAVALLADHGTWLALGLAGLIDVFDPERVVVGGGLVDAGEHLFGPTRAALAGLVVGHAWRPEVPVVAAELGERAGAIGAALLARE